MYKLVVLFSLVALVAGKPSLVAYSAVVPAESSVSQYSSSVVHGSPALVPAVYSAAVPAVYSAPAAVFAPVALSQAPNSPAVVLDAARGVPLDTPEVVAARAAHYQAKALSGLHHLKKRSLDYFDAPLVSHYSAAPIVSHYSAAPIVSHYAASPVVSAYSAAPVIPASPVLSAYSYPEVFPSW